MIEAFTKHGELPLTNQQAKAIAEKIMLELWGEFHPTGPMKILGNMQRIFDREQKSVIVRLQADRTEHHPV